MSIEGWVVGLVVLALTLAWIGTPLLRKSRYAGGDALHQKQRERLLMVYERVLTNIRDLDEDHSTGKMATADYETERELWVGRGIQILKALDRLEENTVVSSGADEAASDYSIDDEIEAAIAAYRSKAETRS